MARRNNRAHRKRNKKKGPPAKGSFLLWPLGKVAAVNSFFVGAATGLARKSAETAFAATKSVSFWCVSGLLNASKRIEHFTGAEHQRTVTHDSKLNGTVTKANGTYCPEIELSRPLNQIIRDVFTEEFTKSQKLSPKLEELSAIKPGSVRTLAQRWESRSEQAETPSGCSTPKSRSTETSMQSTHRDIVNTLELLLQRTNDLKNSLLGNRTLGAPNLVMAERIKSDDQVRVLTLNHKEHQDSTLYRMRKGWVVQFRMGPSLMGRKVSLYCNYAKEEEFERSRYYQLEWYQDEGCSSADDTALFAHIRVKVAGSFHYYFTYAEENTEYQGSGFFLVDPTLKYGDDEVLPLDCVQCQTVLAKSLGQFDNWEAKLRVTKESGYNMIHFTPIQELGDSNSSYSLKEQSKLNPLFNNKYKITFSDIEVLLTKMRKEWKVTSICDIVLNHTANESSWLIDHPEATYNCDNCRYMRPAYLLDAALHQFSLDVKHGMYENQGIPMAVSTEDHLNAIRYALHNDVLSKIRLQEMFICDVLNLVVEFISSARSKAPGKIEDDAGLEELEIIQDAEYRRMKSRVDMDVALRLYNVYRNDCFDEETRIRKCSEEFKTKLDSLNQSIIDKLNDDLNVAISNCLANMRYFRVQEDGPKISEVSLKNPLVQRYFTDYGRPKSIAEHEELLYGANSKYLMAHNGWVMNSDPLSNFASDSRVYLRRELIAWGDSVKLKYGDVPSDCPFLWKHMREYVERMAKMFDGVRLDNCHSTPIPVAEYLLDCARKVKPDLYVVAELFTNSDHKDNIFVNRLGITSLIREAMSAWNSHEQGRLVYRYGGSPVGAFYQPNTRPLVPSIAHAMFLDLTHDNPSPVEKRSAFDLLPSTALVSMACCASGSSRGYDEIVPHHIHVVDETREYAEWTNKEPEEARFVSKRSGIIRAKKALNDLHFYLASEGYEQVYVDQIDTKIVAVTRHNPTTHETVILVAYTAFNHPEVNEVNTQHYIKPLQVEGELDEIILEASMRHKISSRYDKIENYVKDNKYINGYSDYEIVIKEHVKLENSGVFVKGAASDSKMLQLNFADFKPGSIVAIKVILSKEVQSSLGSLRELITRFSKHELIDLADIVKQLSLADLNVALYRCDEEEKDDNNGFGVYNIPDHGPMVYCGLQGVISLLSNVRPSNDLGHPLCSNLRLGDWLIEYCAARLKVHEGTKNLGLWMEKNFLVLKNIPRYLIPAYFDTIITRLYVMLIEQCYDLMSDFVKRGSTFVRALALGSVQFGAMIKSAPLPILSTKIPLPPLVINVNGAKIQACVSLSAGLPHFTTGYTRNWGRDTFIALRGLFILTGRFQEARYHILAYAACLRHGLIPNLLDGGRNARYNCRDAVWWWLYCIQSYVQEAPRGESLLKDTVARIFPDDDSPPQPPGIVDQPLHDVMQEALTVHFQGLAFRERNAGKQIDEHMTDKGFNNQIGIHPDSGFVFGGNEFNCGTWMDKMGSSDRAGNRGKPATPRDGSAVELVGLSKSVISWLATASKQNVYPFNSVERKHKTGTVTRWTFEEWADKIQSSFEKHFWINVEPVQGEKSSEFINNRGIYKDCFGATQLWSDFQLRCNFPVAMVAAPELFDPQHAWTALTVAGKRLLGPLGMKTLDDSDWNYCGDYDNSNDSSEFNVAQGFNYHQGPEWLWPIGYYLRARLMFATKVGRLEETVAFTKTFLATHFIELQTSPWRGLPELTNTDGAYCKDSSRTQAWSMSSILEVLHDLQRIEQKGPTNPN